ncbi:MAG: DUF4326 domain-containing protein [bacterium]|nr:DUF4326 domain-containing protein [bacterium]
MWPVVHFNKEPCDVFIGSPSKWSSPYRVGIDGPREEVMLSYDIWVQNNPEFIKSVRRELPGKRLGCYCAPMMCHGDLLVRIANDWQLARPLIIKDDKDLCLDI